ncbi:MAG: hypothetical protein L6R37_001253 [Teloschistes peruensis]|nr:MAG: hypothetical protein L6R37_001253 [Teloschistes peruensis]
MSLLATRTKFIFPTTSKPNPALQESLRRTIYPITPSTFDGSHPLTHANPEGHSILTGIQELEADIAYVKSKLNELKTQNENIDARITCLELRSPRFLAVRRRFLDVFERELLHFPAPWVHTGNAGINSANDMAHGGNAVADALVFEMDHRRDFYTYRMLYGLDHVQVLELFRKGKDGGILNLVNHHASLIAKKKPRSPQKKAAYSAFIIALEENWIQEPGPGISAEVHAAVLRYYTCS